MMKVLRLSRKKGTEDGKKGIQVVARIFKWNLSHLPFLPELSIRTGIVYVVYIRRGRSLKSNFFAK